MIISRMIFNQTVLNSQDKTLNRRHSLWPTFFEFLFVFFMETVHVVGLVVLTFIALPQMDSVSILNSYSPSNCK